MYIAVTRTMKKGLQKMHEQLRSTSIIEDDEEITGEVEEMFLGSTL